MRRFLALIIGVAAVSACGGHSAPTTPTPTTGGPATAAGSATITGAVQSTAAVMSASPLRVGTAITGVSVTVVGTAISAMADANGRFTLNNVPTGDVQLQFSVGGASATLPVASVQASQSIDLVVVVSGSSASIDSEVRIGGGAESELEGRVEALPPTTAALTFRAAGKLVSTDATTTFRDGGSARTFADLQIGMRVHVKGSPAGGGIKAASVELQNSQTQIPVELNGLVSGLSGNASAFQFTVNGTMVKGDTNTTFFGDGDKPDTFADLKNNLRVEVKGQQQNGFVLATRIHIDTPDTTRPPEDTSASIEGVLKTIGGASPNFSLLVNTTKVQTSSSTTVKRRGDVQTLAALVVGQTLHVIGTRKSDGSIDARQIDIDDDAPGGEFEIEGSIGGLKGTCPSLTFAVNGFSVATNASTTFEGAACSAFKTGDKVEVKGTKQADGSVLATRLKKE